MPPPQEMWETIKHSIVCIMGVPGEEGKEEKIFSKK